MHSHCANHTKHACLLTCSSGLVSALSNPDWPIRRAAADAIKALAIALGPDLDSPSQAALTSGVQSVSCRAAEALERCRFDKVRPVREVVQEAQAVLLDLQVICASAHKALHCHLHYGDSMLASKLPMTKLQANITGLAVGLCAAIMHIFCSATFHMLLHLLAVLVQEYAGSGSSSSGWSAWLAPRLLARGITMSSPPHHRPLSPGRQSPTPRPTSALRRAGSHNRCDCHLHFASLLQEHDTGLHAMLMGAQQDLI